MSYTDFVFSGSGEVIGPEWSVDTMTQVVREMRKASPSPGMQDILVLARIFHELFDEYPTTRYFPTLSRHDDDVSLTQAMVEPSRPEDFLALVRAEAEDVLIASNIARWVLRLPQQASPFVVFIDNPFSEVDIPTQFFAGERSRCASVG